MSPKGDPPSKEQQAQPFYAAIGRAVTNWQCVEEVLGLIFVHLMSPTNISSKISAQAAYYSIVGFRARLAMMDAAAKMQWRGARFRKWRGLKARIDKQNETRNRLAHFSVHDLPSTDGKLRLYLGPTLFDVRYVPYINPPKADMLQYNHADILEMGEKFLRLYREMVSFAIEIGAVLPPPAWGLGYLSGAASYSSDLDPLRAMDADAVFYWIDNYCRIHPLDRFVKALDAFVSEHPK